MNRTFNLAKVVLCGETSNDYYVVEKMIRAAFWNLYKPGCDEHYLTMRLRSHPDYLPDLTRIAVYEGQIVGAIFYAKSKVITSDGEKPVITFGPLAVAPEYQKKGIGGLLLKETLSLAKNVGYDAVIIYGEPNYYPRFGFQRCEKYEITTPDGKYLDALMVYELKKDALKDVRGIFQASDVFFDINQDDVAKYDELFQLNR